MSLTAGHEMTLRALASAFANRAETIMDRSAHETLLGMADAFEDAADALQARDRRMSDQLDHNPHGFHVIRPPKK